MMTTLHWPNLGWAGEEKHRDKEEAAQEGNSPRASPPLPPPPPSTPTSSAPTTIWHLHMERVRGGGERRQEMEETVCYPRWTGENGGGGSFLLLQFNVWIVGEEGRGQYQKATQVSPQILKASGVWREQRLTRTLTHTNIILQQTTVCL